MPLDLTERLNSAFRLSGEEESLLESHPIERGKVEPDLLVSL